MHQQLEELLRQAYHKNNLEGPRNLLVCTHTLDQLRNVSSETALPLAEFTSPYQGQSASELAALIRSQPAGPSAFNREFFLVANTETVSSRKAFLGVHIKADGGVDELLMSHHSMCDALTAVDLGCGSFAELKANVGTTGVYPAKKNVKQGAPAPRKRLGKA
ncbi:hypothetical protein MBLNU459_g2289t2 [Dothideomycetes sp. NU459]